jgi:biotin carboxylase
MPPKHASNRKRILLLLPTTTYRAADFVEAARKLAVELTVASEKRNLLSSQNPEGYLVLDFEKLDLAAKKVMQFAKKHPLAAVLGLDDPTTVAAAYISEKLSLKGNPVEAVEASRNKFKMRQRLKAAGIPVPDFQLFSTKDKPEKIAAKISYPCVLKPTMLAASQGVIRANGVEGFVAAWKRVKKIIHAQKTAPEILFESFIPGVEVALEGLLENGKLRVLALFDKPNPLAGPFFEETIFVRPSRLPAEVQEQIVSSTQRAVEALGLRVGPLHAELRVNAQGPWILEVAARPIGGRCSRSLRFGLGVSLEELILRQALGMDTDSLKPDPTPSGVMMIPIPKVGVLNKISGLEEARKVPGVVEIIMNAHPGQKLVPLPEASAYLGFIFCRAETPEEVEKSIRQAHSCLKFEIES